MGKLLGVLLVAIAVGYQYREQLLSLLPDTIAASFQQYTTSAVNNQQPSTTKAQTPSTDAGPNIKSFPEPEYYNPPFDPENPSEPIFSKSGTRLITLNELAAHGCNGTLKPLWLAVMGRVFDVERGADDYYGPNGGYKFFSGRSQFNTDMGKILIEYTVLPKKKNSTLHMHLFKHL